MTSRAPVGAVERSKLATLETQLKQRLVGAAVLMALGVIFIPIFLAPDDGDGPAPSPIQIARDHQSDQFSSKVQPIEDSALETLIEQADKVVPLAQSGALPPEVETSGSTAANEEKPPSASESGDESVGSSDSGNSPSAGNERTGLTAWLVQAGSFSSRENAEKLAAQLKSKGFSAYIEDITGTKPSYRVRIGPLLSKARAQQTAKSLKKSLNVDGMILKYR